MLAASCAFLSASLPSTAAPPANDTCGGAVVIGSVPYLSPIIDISDATTAGDPPPPPPSTFFDTNVTRSVWYKFRPASGAGGTYTLSVGYDTGTTITDTSMAIYTSTGGACAGATNLHAFNEDSGLLRSAVTTNLAANTDYYIVVWVGPIETATNNLLLQLSVTKPAVPANDTCAGAEVIAGVPFLSTVADTTLATTSSLNPSCAPTDIDRLPSRDVWYRFTPTVSGTYIFSTKTGETATTVDDTLVAIFTAPSCGGPYTELSGSCNDNGVGRAVFARALTAGTLYFIVVWDNSPDFISGETLVQLRVSAATEPSVTTLPLMSIASTGAVLSGTVNANGLQSRFWFEWGPTTGLGNTSQVKLIFANSTTSFTTNLAVGGFLPDTVYHYRFAAANSINTVRGDDYTFVWSSTRPHIDAPARTPSGNFRFQFDGNPAQLYQIQTSTDFLHWGDLGLATNVSSTLFQYIHTHGGLDPDRFYRATLP